MHIAGLVIAYLLSALYVTVIAMPAFYCVQHECRGADLDGFMPAFMLIPFGGIATVFALRDAINHIRKKHAWSWLFWIFAAVLAVVLAATVGSVIYMIGMTLFHR